MGIHWQELVIILVIVLVLFGPRRLPEIGRSLGSGIREFKDGMTTSARTTDSTTKHGDAVPVQVVAADVSSVPTSETTLARD